MNPITSILSSLAGPVCTLLCGSRSRGFGCRVLDAFCRCASTVWCYGGNLLIKPWEDRETATCVGSRFSMFLVDIANIEGLETGLLLYRCELGVKTSIEGKI